MSEVLAHIEYVSNLQNIVDLLSKMTILPDSLNPTIRAYFRGMIKREYDSISVDRKNEWFANLSAGSSERGKMLFEYFNWGADALYDVLLHPAPKFVLFDIGVAHQPFEFDELGNHISEDGKNPMRYPAHHSFSAKVLLMYIDLILEHDPDAVIVLQADHGLHGLPGQIGVEGVMELFSCTAEEAVSIWHSTMSAVRLPDELMTLENEKILSDPRNISRFLVNNFVGENYEYIPYEFRQIFRGPERAG